MLITYMAVHKTFHFLFHTVLRFLYASIWTNFGFRKDDFWMTFINALVAYFTFLFAVWVIAFEDIYYWR